jgi:hypothetical protein
VKDANDELERRYSRDALNGDDAEFGGHEERARIEKKLVRKIDLRVSILIVIYMYVAAHSRQCLFGVLTKLLL